MSPTHPCFAHVSAGRFAEARAVALRLPSIAEVNRSLLDEPGREASV